MGSERELQALKLLAELRREILQSQRLRAYATGAKIAFTSSLLSALVPQIDERAYLLVIPAVAAVFFDLIVNSYSFSIKRLGSYCRHYLDPILYGDPSLPGNFLSWERFMLNPLVKQRLAMFGQLGFTGLAVATACAAIFFPAAWYSPLVVICLLALLVLDIRSFLMPTKLERSIAKKLDT